MAHPIVRVFVNQVEVGALPEPQYNKIVEEVERDVQGSYRLYFAQALHLILVGSRVIRFFLKMMLWLFLGAIVFGMFSAPDVMSEVIGAMRKATPTELVSGIQLMLKWGGFFGIVAMMLATMSPGFRFGYVNQFSSARATGLGRRIRTILEVSADGDMDIYVGEVAQAYGR